MKYYSMFSLHGHSAQPLITAWMTLKSPPARTRLHKQLHVVPLGCITTWMTLNYFHLQVLDSIGNYMPYPMAEHTITGVCGSPI